MFFNWTRDPICIKTYLFSEIEFDSEVRATEYNSSGESDEYEETDGDDSDDD